jgi:hypothetical protein
LPNKLYVEPTGGLEWVRTVFDQTTFLTATTVALNDGEALRGAGLGQTEEGVSTVTTDIAARAVGQQGESRRTSCDHACPVARSSVARAAS